MGLDLAAWDRGEKMQNSNFARIEKKRQLSREIKSSKKIRQNVRFKRYSAGEYCVLTNFSLQIIFLKNIRQNDVTYSKHHF